MQRSLTSRSDEDYLKIILTSKWNSLPDRPTGWSKNITTFGDAVG